MAAPSGAFSKLLGTIVAFFQFGNDAGPGINANGAALETRNATNAAFAVHRGATPVAANDLTTKAYVDAAVAGEGQTIAIVTGTAASYTSTAVLPAGAVVTLAIFIPTTPYSGGATVKLGIAGTTDKYMGTADNDPQAAANTVFQVPQYTSPGAQALVATIGGAPGAGAGIAFIQYSVPQA